MGIKRIVDVGFWTDGKVDDFSPEDKYFMLYLLTNPFTTQLGIYEISVKQAAFQMGYSVDAFNVLLDRFENKYNMIIYSKATGEIAIKNFLRHSVMKGGKPVEDCIKREIARVKNKRLIDYVFESVKRYDDLNKTVMEVIEEYEKQNDNHNDIQNDNHNDNDNENENERTGDVSPTVRTTNRAAYAQKKEKPVKHKYGEYKNVLLTDEELEKLKDKFPDYEERIERLSEYVASKGASYKSHYATILSWSRREKEQQGTGQTYNKPKNRTAEQLEDFYAMASAWSEGS